MAMENKRIIQLSTERTNLTSGDYVMVDSDADGSAKYRLDRLKETDNTLSVSGMAADAAATGQTISDEATARVNAVSAEAEARAAAVTAEAQARAAADTTLGNDVDDLKSAFDANQKLFNASVDVVYNKNTELPLEWENGQIVDGADAPSNVNQRTAFFIPLYGKKIKARVTAASIVVTIYEYDKDFNFLEAHGTGTSFISPVNSNTVFVRLATYSTTIMQDVQHTYVEAFWENDSYVDLDRIDDDIEKAKLSYYTEADFIRIKDGEESYLKAIHILPEQSGSGTPSESNIRPFIQTDEIYLMSSGDNLFPDMHPVSNNAGITMTKTSDGGFKFEGTATGDYYHSFSKSDDHFILQLGDYTFKYSGDTIPSGCALYLSSQMLNNNNFKRTFSVSQYSSCGAYINIPRGNTVDFTIYPKLIRGADKDIDSKMRMQIEHLEFSNLYYGCVADLRSGKVFNNYGYIASYNNEDIKGYWYSDRDTYVHGTKPTVGAEVVYVKDAEESEEITPINSGIEYGVNNIWANHSMIGTWYDATPHLYIDENKNYVTPEMFGAAGDGVTDDTASIQSAIDYAIKYGKDVHLNNNYFVTKTIIINYARGLNLIGRSKCGYDQLFVNSIIHIDNSFSGSALFEINYSRYVSLNGVSLKGYSRSNRYGIYLKNTTSYIKIENCNICKFQKGVYSFYSTYFYMAKNNISQCTTGIEFVGTGDSTLTDNYINTNIDPNDGDDIRSGTGILLSIGSSNNKIVGGKIEWNTKGIYIHGSEGILISNINFDFCPKGSIIIAGSGYANTQCEAICITGNQFRSGGVWGSDKSQIILDPTLKHIYATITGNIFQKASGNDTTETEIGPETVLMTKGNGNPIALVFTGNNLTNGATTNEFVLNSDDETIAYAGNLSNLARTINGDNVVIS